MSFLSEKDVAQLELHSNKLRQVVIEMLANAESGHTAGSLGMADIFSAFYFYILNHNPDNPDDEDRDRLILSNGHIVPVRYAAMALTGYFPMEDINTLRKFGSNLQGHPERTRMPGLETTSGPLGEGLSQASGIALGAIMDGKDFHTYCLMSDGEHQCGVLWEAVMFVGKEKLSNLTAVVDRNNIQISGNTEDVMPLEPLREKYESFGWNVILSDGHDVEMFCDAIEQARNEKEKPTAIISDGAYGILGFEGDTSDHMGLPDWYEPHIKKWSELSTPETNIVIIHS